MDKVQKIRKEVERLMYGFNLEADIASCENAEIEKFADTNYQLCKKILEYIDEVQKQHISEDFEKEIQTTIKMVKYLDLSSDDIVSFCAHHYSKWQKEQLMKNTINGIARPDDDEIWCNLVSSNLKDGDKVKVIVIKENKI